jgi:poly-D-alanine transfer protein DltD
LGKEGGGKEGGGWAGWKGWKKVSKVLNSFGDGQTKVARYKNKNEN